MPTKRSAPPPPSDLDAATDTTPIPERMKQLRGEDLTDCQKALISEFMTSKVSPEAQKAFDKAFRDALSLDVKLAELTEIQAELAKATDPKARSWLEKRIRSSEEYIHILHAQITHFKKQNTLERHRQMLKKSMEYYRQPNPPKTIQGLIERLDDEGALTARPNEEGKPVKAGNTTARRYLRNTLGMKGKPGRKPR